MGIVPEKTGNTRSGIVRSGPLEGVKASGRYDRRLIIHSCYDGSSVASEWLAVVRSIHLRYEKNSWVACYALRRSPLLYRCLADAGQTTARLIGDFKTTEGMLARFFSTLAKKVSLREPPESERSERR